MSQFGPVKSASQVEAALLDVIREWSNSYFGAIEREVGRTGDRLLKRPRTYRKSAGDPLALNDRQLPRVVVQSPGLIDEPQSNGRALTFIWGATVWMFAKGRDEDDTADICRDNAAALRLLLLQKIPDFVDRVEVLDENYDAIPPERASTLAGCELVLSLRVPDAAERGPGPQDADPPQPPDLPVDPGDWPEVEETEATVNRVAADEEIDP